MLKVSYQQIEDRLEVTLIGDYEFEGYMLVIQKMRAWYDDNQTRLGLVNIDQVNGSPNDTERFELAVQAAEQLRGKMCVAVVCSEKNLNFFGETVAVNRGAVALVTDSLEDAHCWLDAISDHQPERLSELESSQKPIKRTSVSRTNDQDIQSASISTQQQSTDRLDLNLTTDSSHRSNLNTDSIDSTVKQSDAIRHQSETASYNTNQTRSMLYAVHPMASRSNLLQLGSKRNGATSMVDTFHRVQKLKSFYDLY